jgi:PAS domain-containing protein
MESVREADIPIVRLLLIQESEPAQRLLEALEHEGLEVVHARINAERGVAEALLHAHWDILIADDSLVGLDCERVLEIARENDPGLPCLLVGDAGNGARAVNTIRRGARDYVDRRDLARLAVVVQRELSAARAQRSAEAHLRAARDQAHAIVEGIDIPLVTLDHGGEILSANPAFLRYFAPASGPAAANPLQAVLGVAPRARPIFPRSRRRTAISSTRWSKSTRS